MPDRAHGEGFPDGRLNATVIPSVFFSEILGRIDHLGELKLILYLFWRFGSRKPRPLFVTREELATDETVRAGLGGQGAEALDEALTRLHVRGLVLRRQIELQGRTQDCYFLNTTRGRQVVRDLESGRLELALTVLPEEPTSRGERPSIFQLYEENVGLLTPLIVEELTDAERRYPGDWIEAAFREAVSYNRRSWKYVQRILERWTVEGKRDEESGGGVRQPRYSPTHRADRRFGR